MSVAGAGMTIKGHQTQHTDIKTNKVRADNLNTQAKEMQAELQKLPPQNAAGRDKVTIVNAQGQLETIELENNSGKLFADERAVLETRLRQTLADAKSATMSSALNLKGIETNKAIGQAVSGLAQSVNTVVAATLRLKEYEERQKETIYRSEQDVNKSSGDSASQAMHEASTLIGKMLEAMAQLLQSRTATRDVIAGHRA